MTCLRKAEIFLNIRNKETINFSFSFYILLFVLINEKVTTLFDTSKGHTSDQFLHFISLQSMFFQGHMPITKHYI